MLAKRNGLIASLRENMPSRADVRERFFSYWPLFEVLDAANAAVVVNADFSCEAADRLAIYLCGKVAGLTPNGCTIFEAWQIASKETVWYPTGGGERERKKERYQTPTLLLAGQNVNDATDGNNQEPIEVEQPAAASSDSQIVVESFATEDAPTPTPTIDVEVTNSGIGMANLPNYDAETTPTTAETKRKYSKRQSLTIEELEAALEALGPEVEKKAYRASNAKYRATLSEQELVEVRKFWSLNKQLSNRRKATPPSDHANQAVAVAAAVMATLIPEQTDVALPTVQEESEVEAARTDNFFRL